MSDIPVNCSFTELRDIVELVPNPKNPKRHPDKQIALYAKIIRHQGWRRPIVISKRSGFIVKGHGALEAAKLLQVDKVPVDVQDYATEAQEWQDMIADNQLAEMAETDDALFKELIESLQSIGADLDLAAVDPAMIEQLIGNIPDSNKTIDETQLAETNTECPKCGFKWMQS